MKRIRIASTGVLLLLLGITAPIYAQQRKDEDKQDKQQHQDQNKRQRVQQQQQDQNKHQRAQQRINRPSNHGRHVQQGKERAVWQQHRARRWQAEHRTWQQRGGYKGFHIPENTFRGHFGQNHWFRIYSLPLMMGGEYPLFQYGGFWFGVVDPWPEYWEDNWYENDDVYIDYSGDGYYMYNRRYPEDRIAICVYLN